MPSRLFDKIKEAFERKSSGIVLSDPASAAILFGRSSTASGSAVSPDSALRVPAVYACVKVISESVAQLPLVLYKHEADGGKSPALDHPLYALLGSAPNEWTTSAEWRLALQASLCAYGNAYSFISRDSAGTVRELIYLHPTQVMVELDLGSMTPIYRVTDLAGVQRVYTRSDIFHVRTFGVGSGFAGRVGTSPITQNAEAIGLAMALEEHGARLFSNGARPSGVFKYGKTLTEAVLKKLRDQFSNTYEGGANSGRTLILEDGMNFEALQFNSVDSQFLELRQFAIAEIGRIFRVPLHLIGELSRSTNNNIEQQNRDFLTYCILPTVTNWEQALNHSLLSSDERKKYFVKFGLDDFTRADLEKRYLAYVQAVTNGLLNPNEVRSAEGLPSYPGGEVFTRQLNTAPTVPDGSQNNATA